MHWKMATRLKEKIGGEITLVSIGNDLAKNALKNGLAVGGDKATLIEDKNYQDSDSLGIAKALAQGIKAIEEKNSTKFDIIFCGKETTDYAAGQVGIMLAGIMDSHLLHGIAVAHRDTSVGFRIEIHAYAERCADLVLSSIALSD